MREQIGSITLRSAGDAESFFQRSQPHTHTNVFRSHSHVHTSLLNDSRHAGLARRKGKGLPRAMGEVDQSMAGAGAADHPGGGALHVCQGPPGGTQGERCPDRLDQGNKPVRKRWMPIVHCPTPPNGRAARIRYSRSEHPLQGHPPPAGRPRETRAAIQRRGDGQRS